MEGSGLATQSQAGAARRPQAGHACLEGSACLDEPFATNTLWVCFSFSDDLNGAGLVPSSGLHTLRRQALAHLPLRVRVCLIGGLTQQHSELRLASVEF